MSTRFPLRRQHHHSSFTPSPTEYIVFERLGSLSCYTCSSLCTGIRRRRWKYVRDAMQVSRRPSTVQPDDHCTCGDVGLLKQSIASIRYIKSPSPGERKRIPSPSRPTYVLRTHIRQPPEYPSFPRPLSARLLKGPIATAPSLAHKTRQHREPLSEKRDVRFWA